MNQALVESAQLPPATEVQVRSCAASAPLLVELAAQHGVTELAFASPGRLRGRVDADRDLFDMFEFQQDAADLLRAEVALFSEGVLINDHVSPDLRAASAL